MKTKQLKIPTVYCIDDYYDFKQYIDFLKIFGIKTIKYYELGYTGGGIHYAVFYEGKRPSKATIVTLLVEQYEFDIDTAKKYLKYGHLDD